MASPFGPPQSKAPARREGREASEPPSIRRLATRDPTHNGTGCSGKSQSVPFSEASATDGRGASRDGVSRARSCGIV